MTLPAATLVSLVVAGHLAGLVLQPGLLILYRRLQCLKQEHVFPTRQLFVCFLKDFCCCFGTLSPGGWGGVGDYESHHALHSSDATCHSMDHLDNTYRSTETMRREVLRARRLRLGRDKSRRLWEGGATTAVEHLRNLQSQGFPG